MTDAPSTTMPASARQTGYSVDPVVAASRAIALETTRRLAARAVRMSRSERIAAIVRGELPEAAGRMMSPLDC